MHVLAMFGRKDCMKVAPSGTLQKLLLDYAH